MEEKKIFENGILVGRFQHIHKGHEKIINIGLNLCDRLLIFIGSSQLDGTRDNPFSVELRAELISKIFEKEIKENRIVIVPLEDFEDRTELSPKWGKYVLNKASEYLGKKAQVIIYGKDKNIFKCFDKTTVKNITEILVDRSVLEISATKMRQFLIENNKTEWEKYANEKIHKYYDKLKNILDKIQ